MRFSDYVVTACDGTAGDHEFGERHSKVSGLKVMNTGACPSPPQYVSCRFTGSRPFQEVSTGYPLASQRRFPVALVDQLPAGLETLKPAPQGTPKVQENSRRQWWNWYEHDNLKDARVEALATTPGEYVLPPLKAEEMYSPEVFRRTATGRLLIE